MNFFNVKILKEDGKYSISVGGVMVALLESKQKIPADKVYGSVGYALSKGENIISAKVDASEMGVSARTWNSNKGNHKY